MVNMPAELFRNYSEQVQMWADKKVQVTKRSLWSTARKKKAAQKEPKIENKFKQKLQMALD